VVSLHSGHGDRNSLGAGRQFRTGKLGIYLERYEDGKFLRRGHRSGWNIKALTTNPLATILIVTIFI
jgi:hypothetical protein